MIPLYTQEEFNKAKSRDKLPLQCKGCGKTFYKGKHKILAVLKGADSYTGNFCSISCRRCFENPPIFIKCEQCGKETRKSPNQIKKLKHHFCSHACACTYSNTHKSKGTRCSKLEKWLATQLPLLYPNLEFHFNRKDAINSELDIYIPSLRLAFELNGIFHYEPIYGEEKLSKTQNNDNRKIQACFEQGIELCIIDVSKMLYFKDANAQKFLDIIKTVLSIALEHRKEV